MKTYSGFARLADRYIPRLLERPFLLDKPADELYELTDDAFAFVTRCDGTRPIGEIPVERPFLRQLLKDRILELLPEPKPRRFTIRTPPLPSVRYLEVQLTARCNLACRHCYLGTARSTDLPLRLLLKTLDEFAALQGLRVILSGGEPLLYPQFGRLNDYLKDYPASVCLLTNGTLLDRAPLEGLHVDEIQVSIDGMERGHDLLRGDGAFAAMARGIEAVRGRTSIPLSFATMVHQGNRREFTAMKRFIKPCRPRSWNIDCMAVAGNLSSNAGLCVPHGDAIRAFRHGFGASYHASGGDGEYACGLHLLTLTAGGSFIPCGFFPERHCGSLDGGLEAAIRKRNEGLVRLSELTDCAGCRHLADCRGGCRYRAGSTSGRDGFMCNLFEQISPEG